MVETVLVSFSAEAPGFTSFGITPHIFPRLVVCLVAHTMWDLGITVVFRFGKSLTGGVAAGKRQSKTRGRAWRRIHGQRLVPSGSESPGSEHNLACEEAHKEMGTEGDENVIACYSTASMGCHTTRHTGWTDSWLWKKYCTEFQVVKRC